MPSPSSPNSSPDFSPPNFEGITLPPGRAAELEAIGFRRIGSSEVLVRADTGGIALRKEGVTFLSDVGRIPSTSIGSVVGIERISDDAAAKDEHFKLGMQLVSELDSASLERAPARVTFLRARILTPDPDSNGRLQVSSHLSLILRSDLACSAVFSAPEPVFRDFEKFEPIKPQLLKAGATQDTHEPLLWRLPFFDQGGPEIKFVMSSTGEIERMLTAVPIRSVGEPRALLELISDGDVSMRGWPKPPKEEHPGTAISFWRGGVLQQFVLGEPQKPAIMGSSAFDLLDLTISNGVVLPLRTNLSAMFSVLTNEWMVGLLTKNERREFNSIINECSTFSDLLREEMQGRKQQLMYGSALTHWITGNGEALVDLTRCFVNGARHFLISHLAKNKTITTGAIAGVMAGHPTSVQEFPLTHADYIRFNIARALMTSAMTWKVGIFDLNRGGPLGEPALSSQLVTRVTGGSSPISSELARLITGYASVCPPGKRWSTEKVRDFVSTDTAWGPDYKAVAEVLEMPKGETTVREFWDTAAIIAGSTQSRLAADCKSECDRFFDLLGDAKIMDLVFDSTGGYGAGTPLTESFRKLRGYGGALMMVNTTYPAQGR